MLKKSTYFFIGKLSDESAKYYVIEYRLKGGFRFEILLDGLVVWGSTKIPFETLMPRVRNMLDIILSAFALKTNKPLNYNLTHWVETKEVTATKNMIGWVRNPYNPKIHYPVRSKHNSAWKKACWLYTNKSKGNSNHILALKDYRSALSDTSPDSLFFAYRATEDICRAVTQCQKIDPKDWEAMRTTLNISRKSLNPLIKASKAVRHGSISERSVRSAMKKRDKMLGISRNVIEREFKRTFPGFF